MIAKAKEKITSLKNGKHYKAFDTFKKHGYIEIFTANMVARLSTTGFPLLIAFFLSSYEVGAIKVFLSYTSLFGILAGLGIEAGIVRYCSSAKEQQKQDSIYSDLLVLGFLYSSIVASMIAILAGASIFSQDENINRIILIGTLSIPFASSTLYSASYLQAQTKFREYAKLNVTFNLAMLPLLLVGTLFWNLTGFVILYNLTFLLMAIVISKSAHKNIFSYKFSGIKITVAKRINEIKFSIFSMLANSAGQLNYTLDIIMMSALAISTTDIGIYGVAQILVFAARQLIMAANQISVPVLSRKFSDSKVAALEHYRKHRRFITMISLILFAGAIVFSPLIPIIFGKEYNFAVPIFILLMAGLVFWSQHSIRGVAFLAYGRNDISLYITLAVLSFNMVLNFIFIKIYGSLGAAIAMLITFIFAATISSLTFKKINIFKDVKQTIRE